MSSSRLNMGAVISQLDLLEASASQRAVLRRRIVALREHVVAQPIDAEELALGPLCRAVLGTDDAARLRDFRFELNLMARDRQFAFVVDGQKRASVNDRRCWFEGEHASPAWLAEQLAAQVHSLGPTVDARVRRAGTTPTLRVRISGRLTVLIANHADDAPAARVLRDALDAPLRNVAPGWEVVITDLIPLAGERLADVAAPRYADASVVIAAVSPLALAENLIPADLFVDVPVLPVRVKKLPTTAELGRIGELSFLPDFIAPKREASALAIADRIGELLRDVAPVPMVPDRPDGAHLLGLRGRALDELTHYERANVVAQGLDGTRHRSDVGGEDLMTCLTSWLLDPSAPPYFALLGEYGMGKTTGCQVFARLVASNRENEWPEVILFDLRTLSDSLRRSDPTLDVILDDLLKRSFKTGSLGPMATAQQVLDRVQRHGALVIYDGLDEVMVAQTDVQRQQFVRELLRTLPLTAIDDPNRRAGRVLLTCRTHHFRTVAEEHSLFRSQDRDGVEQRYRAAYLLPFGEDQIRSYLEHHVADRPGGVAKALELIRSVHNLTELTQRPVNLRMVVELLGEIEATVATGASINAAGLYDRLVMRWLDRDDGKHQFVREHKLRLMEDLAGHLVGLGVRSIAVVDLENWLRRRIVSVPELKDWFDLAGVKIDVLCEDLRTATFIVRPGDDRFEFAHTSLLEYFHARLLFRALTNREFDTWAVEGVSEETIRFLLDLVADSPSADAFRRGFEGLAHSYVRVASELALRVAITGSSRGVSVGSTAGFDLRGLNWPDLRIDGPFDLSDACLSEATLRRARFTGVDLRDADLGGAVLVQAEFVDCDLRDSMFPGADLSGATLRRCVGGAEGAWGEWSVLPGTADPDKLRARRVVGAGHMQSVTDVAWSPDGRRLLTGSRDGTARVWDARNGAELLQLTEHSLAVTCVGWSPDGRRLATGSADGSVWIRDAGTGELLRRLAVGGGVSCIAWSPDSGRILVGSDDVAGTVWDPSSGLQLFELTEREKRRFSLSPDGRIQIKSVSGGGVRCVAWSPDSGRCLTGSDDGTVRVWDTGTGAEFLELAGHHGLVTGAEWSPDGSRILSGSRSVVKIWDSATGAEIQRLPAGASCIAWSPDGSRLLASDASAVWIWDAQSGLERLELFEADRTLVCCVAWSPDSSCVLAGFMNGTARTYNVGTGALQLQIEAHRSEVRCGAWSPVDSRVAIGLSGGGVSIWDAATGTDLVLLATPGRSASGVAWSPDGSKVVTAFDGDIGGVSVWDSFTVELLLEFAADVWVSCVAWSPDGNRVVIGAFAGGAWIWDTETGALVQAISGDTWVNCVAWSPDGGRVLGGFGNGVVKIWDADTGSDLLDLAEHREPVNSVAWSPDGTRVLAGAMNFTRVWDAETGAKIREVSGPVGAVSSVVWSSGGSCAFIASDDGTAKFEEVSVASGRNEEMPPVHAGAVTGVAWSPEGTRTLIGNSAGAARIWDATNGTQLPLALWHLGDGECAAVSDDCEVVAMTDGAWRWLRFEVEDPETGMRTLVPIEEFGPVPGFAVSGK